MARMPERTGTSGIPFPDSVISTPNRAVQRQRHSTCTEIRLISYLPKKAVSLIGANPSSSWKRHAAVSTPAPSASAAVKSRYAPFPSKAIRERLQLIHATWHQKRACTRPYFQLQYLAGQKNCSELFLEYHPDIRFHLEIHPALLVRRTERRIETLLPEGLLTPGSRHTKPA